MTSRFEIRRSSPAAGAGREPHLARVQSLIDLEQAKADRDQGVLDREQTRGEAVLSRVDRERRDDGGLHGELFDLEEGACHRAQEARDAEQAIHDFVQAEIDRAQNDLDLAAGRHEGERSRSQVLRGFAHRARRDARSERDGARDARLERRFPSATG